MGGWGGVGGGVGGVGGGREGGGVGGGGGGREGGAQVLVCFATADYFVISSWCRSTKMANLVHTLNSWAMTNRNIDIELAFSVHKYSSLKHGHVFTAARSSYIGPHQSPIKGLLSEQPAGCSILIQINHPSMDNIPAGLQVCEAIVQ